MKYNWTPLLFISLITIFSGCCDNKELGRINFKQSELEVNPYKGNETLNFIDNKNNVITFAGHSRRINTNRMDGCAECCQDYYTVQSSDNTLFSSEYLNSQISVNLVNNFDEFSLKTNPSISFSWSDHPNQEKIENIIFLALPIHNVVDSASTLNLYHDTLRLRNKTFHKIIASPVSINFSDRLHPDTIFYSVTEGFVGIKFSDGNLLVKE